MMIDESNCKFRSFLFDNWLSTECSGLDAADVAHLFDIHAADSLLLRYIRHGSQVKIFKIFKIFFMVHMLKHSKIARGTT